MVLHNSSLKHVIKKNLISEPKHVVSTLKNCLYEKWPFSYTGQPRFVKLAYLKFMAYVELIIHSQAFPLYCFVFQTCVCRTWLSQNLRYIEVVFHSRKLVFLFFTTNCVEANFVFVKKLNNMNVKQNN